MIGEQLEVPKRRIIPAVSSSSRSKSRASRQLDSRLVKIHHFLVDYVVVPRPKYHVQSFSTHG